jgi:hypothetical protein
MEKFINSATMDANQQVFGFCILRNEFEKLLCGFVSTYLK